MNTKHIFAVIASFLSACLLVTAEPGFIRPAGGGGGTTYTGGTNIVVSGSVINVAPGTVDASSIFTPNSLVPAQNLSNVWMYLGSAVCNLTGTTWTFNVPTCQVLRIVGRASYDGGTNFTGVGNGYAGLQFNGDAGNNYVAQSLTTYGATSSAAKGSLTNWFIPLDWQGDTCKTGTIYWIMDLRPGNNWRTNTIAIPGNLEAEQSGQLPAGNEYAIRVRFRYNGGTVLTNITLMNTTAPGKLITGDGSTRVDFYGVK